MWHKQCATQLAARYGRSVSWIRQQLDQYSPPLKQCQPYQTVIIADSIFWGRYYGITVFRDPHHQQNLFWREVATETVESYIIGKQELTQRGFVITAIVSDGKPGLKEVFADIPFQLCQFHQIATIHRYLTRNPKLPAGKDLRLIALSLPQTSSEQFTERLLDWHKQWGSFIKQKTVNKVTGRWFYTHKRLRSAYRSLIRNQPYLFTYQQYPALNIPNTTNSLEGSFRNLKTMVRVHPGLNKRRRYRVITEILGKSGTHIYY